MIIGGIEIPELALNIFNDIKSKIKVNLSISVDYKSCVRNISDNSYLISLSVDKNEDAYDLGFRLVHEIMHIYQFENGYQRIIKCLIPNLQIKEILSNISDFVLDTDIHQYLINEYQYDVRKNTRRENSKYYGYKASIEKIHGELNELGEKLMAVELAYIHFNDSEDHAVELNNMLYKIAPNTSTYYNQILQEYKNGVKISSEFATEKIIRICQFLGFDNCYELGK